MVGSCFFFLYRLRRRFDSAVGEQRSALVAGARRGYFRKGTGAVKKNARVQMRAFQRCGTVPAFDDARTAGSIWLDIGTRGLFALLHRTGRRGGAGTNSLVKNVGGRGLQRDAKCKGGVVRSGMNSGARSGGFSVFGALG
eukprot:IDg4338t1